MISSPSAAGGIAAAHIAVRSVQEDPKGVATVFTGLLLEVAGVDALSEVGLVRHGVDLEPRAR